MRRNYRITYEAKEPIIQERTLVTRDEYEEYRDSIIALDDKNTNEDDRKEALKYKSSFPDNFFVVGSPLFKAIKTGKVFDAKVKMEISWKH